MIEDLGDDEGLDSLKTGLIALCDADTIAYAACLGAEYAEDIMPESFYTPEEYQAIVEHKYYDADEGCVWNLDLDSAVAMCEDRINEIILETNTDSAELYFTAGKNFRYKVDPMYKANRKGRTPTDLQLIKEALAAKYEGCICEKYEADDIVVYKKRTEPDKYVMAAVDKDVLGAVKGRHFNYYRSARYGIDMKWITTSYVDALRFPYLQTLMGDTTDNIRGCPGIGPKKAQAILDDLIEPKEMWDAVVKTFESKKLTVKEALMTMRLVQMNQLMDDGSIELWNPPL